MNLLKSLSNFALTALAAIAFVACSQNQQPAAQKVSAEPEENQPSAHAINCYDANGRALPEAGALSVDSVKIVYEHRPSEIVMAVRNVTASTLGNVRGVINLYGEDGLKYDSIDFSKSCQINGGETSGLSIYLGDKRVHPNQEWNRDVLLHFAPTAPGRFSYVGCDNNWCECIAKVVEVKITSFEVVE